MVVAPVLQALHAKDDFLNFGRSAWNDPAAAQSKEHYQNVLQVVEQDRKRTPNLRKRKLNDAT